MIGKLTGVYAGRQGESSVVDVGGVGYCVRTPYPLELAEGTPLSLHIHTAVRDDAIDLYGFREETELVFFRQLMTVSSVGPKTALSIMGTSDIRALQRAIAGGDATTLIKVFGIGKKSAERIVVELRDKLGHHGVEVSTPGSHHTEAIEALISLGYSATESRNAIQRVSPSATLQETIGAALKQLGSPVQQAANN